MRSILIIEDNRNYNFLLTMRFQKAGFKVFNAYNGSQGIEALKRLKDELDIVLLDIMMPVMNGVELIRELDNINGCPPVCLLSSLLEDTMLKEFKSQKVIGYFSKSVDTLDIVHLVKAALNKNQAIENLMTVYKVEEIVPNFEIIKDEAKYVTVRSKQDVGTNSVIRLRTEKGAKVCTVENVSMDNGEVIIYARKLA